MLDKDFLVFMWDILDGYVCLMMGEKERRDLSNFSFRGCIDSVMGHEE